MDHNLNVKPKATKYLEENLRRKISMALGQERFLRYETMIPQRKKKDQLDSAKLVSALQNTLTSHRLSENLQNPADSVLTSRIYN